MKHHSVQSGGYAPLETARARSARPSLMGFTLIELLVSIGIFTLMTGIVLANYKTYDTNALFANASEDIVLALRQAQVYGVGVRGTGTSFDVPYGVYFLKSSPSQIIVFADNDSNGLYSTGDTVVDTVKWQSNIQIKSTGGISCDFDSTVSGIGITFKRPNPDALITREPVGTSCNTGKITIADVTSKKYSTTTVSSTGQISFQ